MSSRTSFVWNYFELSSVDVRRSLVVNTTDNNNSNTNMYNQRKLETVVQQKRWRLQLMITAYNDVKFC